LCKGGCLPLRADWGIAQRKSLFYFTKKSSTEFNNPSVTACAVPPPLAQGRLWVRKYLTHCTDSDIAVSERKDIMQKFMTEDFLLNTEAARRLYHEHAEHMPIIDYHCHIPAADILNDVRYDNITQLWLAADHYKWRLIRANGEAEHLVTAMLPTMSAFAPLPVCCPAPLAIPFSTGPIWSSSAFSATRGF